MQIQTFKKTVLLFGVQLLLASPVVLCAPTHDTDAKKSTVTSKKTSAKTNKAKSQKPTPAETFGNPRRRWWFYAGISTIFDSNIDHDDQNTRSFGLVPNLGVHFQDSLEKPRFQFDYQTASHSYTNTDRWDRLSHKLRASYERRFGRKLIAETIGEITNKGSSEDRELNNQYVMGQEIEFRATRAHRFKLFGAYRIKRSPEDPGRDAINPYIGGNFEKLFGSNRSLEVGYRYDKNRSRDPRNRYIRWTYGAEFKTPFLHRDSLTFEVKYRPQLYARIIEIEDEHGDDHDVTRRDRRRIFGASWERWINENLTMGFVYRLETRRSNDVEKNFNSHLAGATLTYRWWR
jgi:hypothetical protein